LLGRHVARRAHRDAGQGEAATAFQASSQAEIRDLGSALAGQQDIGRFQIAVNDPALVSNLDGVSQRGHQRGGLSRRLGRARQLLGQVATLDKFHREIRPAVHLAGFVNLHDIRMTQTGHCLGLAQEPLQLLRTGVRTRQEHFQSDGAVETLVPGVVDNAYPAVAQHPLHFVAAYARQVGSWQHWRCAAVRNGRLRKQRADLGLDGTNPLPGGLNLRQQLGAHAASFFGRAV
jgi:hypothetical protein